MVLSSLTRLWRMNRRASSLSNPNRAARASMAKVVVIVAMFVGIWSKECDEWGVNLEGCFLRGGERGESLRVVVSVRLTMSICLKKCDE